MPRRSTFSSPTRARAAAIDAAQRRSGRWFDPDLVKAAASLADNGALWTGLDDADLMDKVAALEPEQRRMTANEDSIDNICLAFADIIDAKSPFTYRHSNGVADAAMEIGCWLGMSPRDMKLLRRAALLHDIGKLSVSNAILEKPGKLTSDEWKVVQRSSVLHLRNSEENSRICGASAKTPPRTTRGSTAPATGAAMAPISFLCSARILAVADVFDALHAKRPYRDSMPLEKVFEVMREDAPRALDPSLSRSFDLVQDQPRISVLSGSGAGTR